VLADGPGMDWTTLSGLADAVTWLERFDGGPTRTRCGLGVGDIARIVGLRADVARGWVGRLGPDAIGAATCQAKGNQD
jgi:hypothetical protein